MHWIFRKTRTVGAQCWSIPSAPSMENPLLPRTKPNLITFQPNPKSSPPPGLNHLSLHPKLQQAISDLEQNPHVRPKTYISLLQSCIDSDSIDLGRKLHASIQDPNPFIQTKLVSMYAKCGSLDEARRVFHTMPERNLFSWSAMINACARQHIWEEVVDLFHQMMHEGITPDLFLLPRILQACGNTEDAVTGRLIHSLAVRSGFLGSTRVSNSMLAMYVKCGQLVEGKRLFDLMEGKDLVTWNSIISGYCNSGLNDEALRQFEQMRAGGVEPGVVTWNVLIASCNQSGKPELAMELMKKMERSGVIPDVFTWTSMISGLARMNMAAQALDIYREMQLSGVEPNDMTIASLVSACACLKNLKNGRELHSYAIKIGGASNLLVVNSLIDMYAKCGYLEDARRAFDLTSEKDVFAWNSMIGGYMNGGYCGEGWELFSKMENSGVKHNAVTWNLMISGYMQNGDVDTAIEIFQRMESDGVRRNTSSWNALIAGLLHNGHINKAFATFRRMQAVSARPNSVTILSILPACGNLVAAGKVKEIHACILHCSLESNVSIGNALMDAYSKSGDICSAQTIFSCLSTSDSVPLNTLKSRSVLY